jgi:HK97 family phage portal protein
MSLRSRMSAAWRGLTIKDIGDGAYGPLAAFVEVYGSQRAKSGQTVNFSTALQVATVLGITRVLCEGVAQVPLKLFRDRADGRGADPAIDHPLYRVLYRRPNPWQTSFRFRETMMLHLVLCNNFFAFKNIAGGQVRELIPFQPGDVDVRRNPDLSLVYRVRNAAGVTKEFPQEAIMHLRGPSWNSWMGMEAVKLAREAIGLTMAIEADQASLYKNGLRASGTYSVEGTLTGQQYEDLRKHIDKHRNEDNGGPLILDMAAKYLQQTITGVDAQTLESRRFQVEEVCRPFRVMPIMVGHADKAATYASAEQMFLAHVVHTLCPWYERLQQDFDVQLLDPDRDEGLYTKFIVNALMRGTAEARANYYKAMLGAPGQKGWGSQNEVRELEDMNLSDDPEADSISQPLRISDQALPKPGSITDPLTPTPVPIPETDQ